MSQSVSQGRLTGSRYSVNMKKVLGIDVASGKWRDNGSALLEFDAGRFTRVTSAAISWPQLELTPAALAVAILEFCIVNCVEAIALDGPQGWRDPARPDSKPGVGRQCELLCRTQGKTGAYPKTYPSTQRAWIQFSIDLFDELLRRPHVRLFEGGPTKPGELLIMECFPTSTWRSAGLKPLPGKAKRPALESWTAALTKGFSLPAFVPHGHDDLQAVVAALCAAGAMGGPCSARPLGLPAGEDAAGRRTEGMIWDAAPH